MAAKFVAAIDHGTTSTRCILFDRLGSPVAIAQRAQTMHYPKPGWVELDMQEVWNRTQECIHEALGSAGAAPADVAAIGITNERESVLLWDRRTGRPVAHAIVWQDTRTAAAADALAADGGIQRLQDRTGLPISTYSSALKLGWLLNQDRAKRPAVRNTGHLAALEPHRRSGRWGARNRPDEREPHPPDEPAHARLGSG